MPQRPSSPSEFFNALSNIDIAASQGPIPKGIEKLADIILKRIETNRATTQKFGLPEEVRQDTPFFPGARGFEKRELTPAGSKLTMVPGQPDPVTTPIPATYEYVRPAILGTEQANMIHDLGLRADPDTAGGQKLLQSVLPNLEQGSLMPIKEDTLMSINALSVDAKKRALAAGYTDFIPLQQARLIESAIKGESVDLNRQTAIDLQKQSLKEQKDHNQQSLELRKQMLTNAKDEKTRARLDKLSMPYEKIILNPLSTPEQVQLANDSLSIIHETGTLPEVIIKKSIMANIPVLRMFAKDTVSVKARNITPKAEQNIAPKKEDDVTFDESSIAAQTAINSGTSREAVIKRLRESFPSKADKIFQTFGSGK